MCEVCKADQKCGHPWAQCMASRGEDCAADAQLRELGPEGAASRGGSSPSGECRTCLCDA
jgi:hypothetical protein